MATGRADYWYGMLPGKNLLGIGQSEWFKFSFGLVAVGGSTDFIEYTVPANYLLYFGGGSISCEHPGIQRFSLMVNDDVVFSSFFDSFYTFPDNSGFIFVVKAGDILKVRCYNADNVPCYFYISFLGFEQYQIV